MIPGEVVTQGPPRGPSLEDAVEITVRNEAPVPIGVTSHFHFFEVNPALRFDREAAYGRRLAVPVGAIVWFPPGEDVTVLLIPYRGRRVVIGFNGLVDGPLER